jgi:CRISPR-associated protein Cst2
MPTQNNKVYEVAIVGRITWNLHSLNNEGNVGNVIEPRTLILADGTLTDGISGEMLKHIHAYCLWQLISEKTKNLCSSCQEFNPERADANEQVRKTKKPEEAIDEALKCIICDIHGFLVQKPTVSREAAIEFGWAVGIPDKFFRETHTHIRHSPREAFLHIEEERKPNQWSREKCNNKNCTTSPADSPLYKVENKWYCEKHLPKKAAQMVYHRPTRSGIYGIISVFQPWRISLNDVTLKYLSNIDRKTRYKLGLEAYIAMFLHPEGAMSTTRLPHTDEFKGVIIYTQTNFPVPVISPLKDSFINQINDISSKINAKVQEFDTLQKFIEEIRKLEELEPWSG